MTKELAQQHVTTSWVPMEH